MRRYMMWVVLPWLLLTACGGDEESPSVTQTPLPPAINTQSPVFLRLQRNYEGLHDGLDAISEIWESLATGEEVQCGQYPASPSPESISAEGDPTYEALAERLRSAAIDLDTAINLWEAECKKTRAIPSLDVINQGLLAVGSAGDALREAENLLQ
ncbi:MAG TPA: hypothetical protein VHP83_21715 [Aggregatilineaceae bacterium]|nr:hypothetical protein [Aggregatilineaceae bacterium]